MKQFLIGSLTPEANVELIMKHLEMNRMATIPTIIPTISSQDLSTLNAEGKLQILTSSLMKKD
jgi:hypothetical protein